MFKIIEVLDMFLWSKLKIFLGTIFCVGRLLCVTAVGEQRSSPSVLAESYLRLCWESDLLCNLSLTHFHFAAHLCI